MREDRVTTWRTRAQPTLIALCLVLAACGKSELYSKLSEGQANEMIAVLQASGLSASKQENSETGWTVSTSSADFSKAVEVLHAQGYPRDDFASLGTVFKKEGFVSSPTEERARLVYGMSQELSHTISEIDGVVQARVHLALPEDKPLAESTQPSSASVFIKYRPGTNIEGQVGKIKSLLVNSVEGLKYQNISVETFPAQPLPTAAATTTEEQATSASLVAIGIPILLLVALGLGYPSLRRWQQRRTAIVKRDR